MHRPSCGRVRLGSREARTPAAEQADYVIERLKDHGILLSTDGPNRNVIKIKPPLAFSDEDAERLVAVLDAVLAEGVVVGSGGSVARRTGG